MMLPYCFLSRQKVDDFDNVGENTNPAPRQYHICAKVQKITEQLS